MLKPLCVVQLTCVRTIYLQPFSLFRVNALNIIISLKINRVLWATAIQFSDALESCAVVYGTLSYTLITCLNSCLNRYKKSCIHLEKISKTYTSSSCDVIIKTLYLLKATFNENIMYTQSRNNVWQSLHIGKCLSLEPKQAKISIQPCLTFF